MKNVLVVEDDRDLVGLLHIHLTDLDCKVDVALNGKDGLQKILSNLYDLIILDIMLPLLNGNEICQMARQKGITTPIIMLTAKSEEQDKVYGLENGADDYITKPFGVREFIARIKAIFRRKELNRIQQELESEISFSASDLTIDYIKRSVRKGNKRLELSPKEFELLALLSSNPGKSYTRANLLEIIWGYDFDGYEHTVNSHINRLRSKIETDMSNPEFILTSWGVGYRFNEEI